MRVRTVIGSPRRCCPISDLRSASHFAARIDNNRGSVHDRGQLFVRPRYVVRIRFVCLTLERNGKIDTISSKYVYVCHKCSFLLRFDHRLAGALLEQHQFIIHADASKARTMFTRVANRQKNRRAANAKPPAVHVPLDCPAFFNALNDATPLVKAESACGHVENTVTEGGRVSRSVGRSID